MSTKPPKTLNEVLVLQGKEEVSPQLREFLRAKGFPTNLVSDESAVVATLQKLSSPVLLVFAGKDPAVSKRFRTFLLSEPSLAPHPVFFIGPGSTAEDKELAGVFEILLFADAATSNTDILEGLRKLGKAAGSGRLSGKMAAPEAGGERAIPEVERVAPPPSPQELYSRFPKIPDLAFELLQTNGLIDTILGGEDYPGFHDLVKIEQTGISPKQSRYHSAIVEFLTGLDPWGHAHLYRTAYMGDKLAEALRLPPELRHAVRDGAFLIGWGFAQTGKKDYLRVNYLHPKMAELRKSISGCVAAGAERVTRELSDPQLGSFLELVSKLVTKDVQLESDERSLAASLLMACELVDRVCFQSGRWDTRAAYTLVRKMKDGTLSEMHPTVLACLLKYLSEAVILGAASLLIPMKIRKDPALLAEAERRKNEPVGPGEMKVPILQLVPGMKLSRPLVAFDGRLVLPGDLILDRDLIWRLWQLSAIRPLNGPVIVISAEDRAALEAAAAPATDAPPEGQSEEEDGSTSLDTQPADGA